MDIIPFSDDPVQQMVHILLIAALDRLGGELLVTETEYDNILARSLPPGALRIRRTESGNIHGSLRLKVS